MAERCVCFLPSVLHAPRCAPVLFWAAGAALAAAQVTLVMSVQQYWPDVGLLLLLLRCGQAAGSCVLSYRAL